MTLLQRVHQYFRDSGFKGAVQRMESGGVWVRLERVSSWGQSALVAHLRDLGLDAHVHTWADEWGRGGVIVVRGDLERASP